VCDLFRTQLKTEHAIKYYCWSLLITPCNICLMFGMFTVQNIKHALTFSGVFSWSFSVSVVILSSCSDIFWSVRSCRWKTQIPYANQKNQLRITIIFNFLISYATTALAQWWACQNYCNCRSEYQFITIYPENILGINMMLLYKKNVRTEQNTLFRPFARKKNIQFNHSHMYGKLTRALRQRYKLALLGHDM
jgi:hypothetical protein